MLAESETVSDMITAEERLYDVIRKLKFSKTQLMLNESTEKPARLHNADGRFLCVLPRRGKNHCPLRRYSFGVMPYRFLNSL